jgi:hypothetical protein
MYTLLRINLEDNRQIGPIVVIFAIVVVIVLFIVAKAFRYKDRHKEKSEKNIDAALRADQIINQVEVKSKKAEPGEKVIHQVKRETRDPQKKAEQEAAAKNTLLGGKSEAQMEKKDAIEVFGPLGISSKKAKQIDKSKERVIVNGYLQKSNTAPIRPVYSNTLFARQLQRKELESDEVGKEAQTPALVMDSAAPSEVKITGAPVQKVKPTALKRPTAARVTNGEEQSEETVDTTYIDAMRPQTGTEVSNAVVDFTADVQEEKPDIIKSGEEAIIPAAQEAKEGFVPDKEVLENNAREEA